MKCTNRLVERPVSVLKRPCARYLSNEILIVVLEQEKLTAQYQMDY